MYGGNWSAYVARRRVEFDAQLRAYEEQQARRRELLDSAAHIAGRAQGFQAMSQNDFYRSRGKKLARRATVQLARVERQLSALAEPLPPRRPHFVVRSGDPRDAALLRARAISVGHAGAALLLDDFSLTLHHGDRVAIAGASGTGKTSLLRTLLGELPPQAGDVHRPRDLRACHLAQSQATWNGNLRAVDVVRRVATVTEDEGHVIIASVLFDDVATRPMRSFSAGERRRIELAAMFAARPELLALDEPSNHLDLPTLEMLEEALADYRGALLVVSHDRYLLERLQPQRVIALDAETRRST
jgi:ATP-binding cassette, subfamily F, member 3